MSRYQWFTAYFGEIANINAFAIGASLIDPKAKIFLNWTTVKEKESISARRPSDICVFSGQDLIKPNKETRRYGLYQITDDGTIQNLAVPVCDWGRYYELLLGSVLNGTWDLRNLSSQKRALNYWMGMSAGVVNIILSRHLKQSTVRMIDCFRKMLIEDTFHPFEGKLFSQQGLIECSGERLSNDQIIEMNWLNENVIGSIPKINDLTDYAKSTVLVSGVTKEQ